jgi:hypothetical protein
VECMCQAFQVPANYVGLYMVAYILQHNGQGKDHFPSHSSRVGDSTIWFQKNSMLNTDFGH